MKVLVTGGAGYIGSHAVRELLDSKHQVTVLDNLGHGHRQAVDPRAQLVQADTGDREFLADFFTNQKFDAVMHFAADIEVGESVTDPAKYYKNNFTNAMTLLTEMRNAGIQRFVFSSTAAVYGNPEKTPIEENQLRAPINPYGRSKMMVEMAVEDFSKAYGLGSIILRYFNVAGAHPSGEIGEDHQPESHLIPRILLAAREGETVKMFGTDYPTADGTCIRDYVHVVDLARAHVLALEKIKPGSVEVFNLGSESGFSVREVIAACERVTGRQIKVQEEGRRPGDPAILVASPKKAQDILGWKRMYPKIESLVEHAWNWHMTHPKGYASKKTSVQSGLET